MQYHDEIADTGKIGHSNNARFKGNENRLTYHNERQNTQYNGKFLGCLQVRFFIERKTCFHVNHHCVSTVTEESLSGGWGNRDRVDLGRFQIFIRLGI